MSHLDSKGETRFRCEKYINHYFMDPRTMRRHVCIHGFIQSYETWTYHGEPLIPSVIDVAPSNDMVDGGGP